MTYTPIAKGTTSWDVPVNAAFVDQDDRITANESDIKALEDNHGFWSSDLGFIAWNFDPGVGLVGQSAFTAGTVHMMRIDLKGQATVTNIIMGIQTAGVALTADQCFAGIYDASGTRLGITADMSTQWLSVGVQTMPLTSPLALAAGTYYVAVVSNGTTQPSMARSAGATTVGPIMNAGLTVSNARWANDGTSQTSLPTSITMSSRTYGATGWWVALN